MAGLGNYKIGQPPQFYFGSRGETYNASNLQSEARRRGITFQDIVFEKTGKVNGMRMNEENYAKVVKNNFKVQPPRPYRGGRSFGRFQQSDNSTRLNVPDLPSDSETLRPVRPSELRYDVDGGIIYPIRPTPPSQQYLNQFVADLEEWGGRNPVQDRIDRDKAEVGRLRDMFAGVTLEGMVDDEEEGGNTAGEGSREIAVIPFYTDDWDDLSSYQKDIAIRLLNKNADNWSDMMTQDWNDLSGLQKEGMKELGMDEDRWTTEYLPITREEEEEEEEEEIVPTRHEERFGRIGDLSVIADEVLMADSLSEEEYEEYEYNLGDITSDEEVVVDGDEVVPEKTADEKIVDEFERELEEELRKPVIQETRERINDDLERRAVNKFVPVKVPKKVGKKKGAKAFRVKKTTIEEDLADFDDFLDNL